MGHPREDLHNLTHPVEAYRYMHHKSVGAYHEASSSISKQSLLLSTTEPCYDNDYTLVLLTQSSNTSKFYLLIPLPASH